LALIEGAKAVGFALVDKNTTSMTIHNSYTD